jgi:hypothetical protein
VKHAQLSNDGLAAAQRAGLQAALLALALLATACSAPPQQDSISQRQDAALKDPMGYKVPPDPDVTDNNSASFDKSGFQKDVNDALNP